MIDQEGTRTEWQLRAGVEASAGDICFKVLAWAAPCGRGGFRRRCTRCRWSGASSMQAWRLLWLGSSRYYREWLLRAGVEVSPNPRRSCPINR